MERLKSLADIYRKDFGINFQYRCCKIYKKHHSDGLCRLIKRGRKKCFFIQLNSKYAEYYLIDVLIHEVAHCLAWGKEKDDHGPCWGRAYSQVYRKYLEWNDQYNASFRKAA